jgi:gas vesicle protein
MNEHDSMTALTHEHRGYGFAIGLVTGSFVGAGLAMWLAPRFIADLRDRMTDSATDLSNRASQQYRQTSARVGDAVADLTRKGQDVRDDVAEAVARGAREVARGAHEVERGAHEVESYATAAKSDRVKSHKSEVRS